MIGVVDTPHGVFRGTTSPNPRSPLPAARLASA